jgi:hypothetical protein
VELHPLSVQPPCDASNRNGQCVAGVLHNVARSRHCFTLICFLTPKESMPQKDRVLRTMELTYKIGCTKSGKLANGVPIPSLTSRRHRYKASRPERDLQYHRAKSLTSTLLGAGQFFYRHSEAGTPLLDMKLRGPGQRSGEERVLKPPK